ncbi:MAG: cytochrome PufQ [Paracoccaceae bacterium]
MTEAKRSKAPHKPSPLEYGLYFGASFIAFLPIAAVRQVLPAPRDALGRTEKRRGVIGEARAMAAGILPFVFMH